MKINDDLRFLHLVFFALTAAVLMVACGGGGGGNSTARSDIFALDFGDANIDVANGVAVDGDDNILLAGSFAGSINFGGPTLSTSGEDIFVAKFDSTGLHQWSLGVGTGSEDIAMDIAVDDNGDVFVVGTFDSNQIDFGGQPLIRKGDADLFIAKLDGSDGSRIWSLSVGNAGVGVYANTVAIDPSGNVVVAGSFSGDVDFGGGTISHAGFEDVFVARYSGNNGAHLYSDGFGDSDLQTAEDIAIDSLGNIVLTGNFKGNIDFGGGNLAGNAMFSEIFLAKLGPLGTHLYSNDFEAPSGNSAAATSLAIDSGDNMILGGYFQSSIDFGGGVLNAASVGDRNVYLARFDASGMHLYSAGFGDDSLQEYVDVDIDASDNMILFGNFDGAIDFGGGALNTAGGQDLFLAQLSSNGTHLDSARFGDSMEQAAFDLDVRGSSRLVLTGAFRGSIDFGSGVISSTGTNIFLGSLAP